MKKEVIIQNRIQQIKQNSFPSQREDYNSKYRTLIGLIGCMGGLVVELGVGNVYQWGIINIYIASYYRLTNSSLTLSQTAIAFPLMMFSMGLTIRLGLYFSQKTSPLISLTVVKITSSAAVFASSYAPDIWTFIILFGIVFGLVEGMTIAVPIVQCNKYFPGYKLYINGFILTGIGMGSLIFGLVSYNFLNPRQLPTIAGYYSGTPQLIQIARNVPELIRWLSLIFLSTGIFGVVLMIPLCLANKANQNAQKQVNMIQFGAKENAILPIMNQFRQKIIVQIKKEASSVLQALKTYVCWVQVFILIFGSTGLHMINGNYKTYVKGLINDDAFLTLAGVLGSLANGLSRFIWGTIFTKTGYRFVVCLNLTITIIVLATLKFSVLNKAGFIIEIFLANFCIGGYFVSLPSYGQIVFGQQVGSNIYGFYWCVLGTSNFLQFIYLQNIVNKIGFDNVFYICLGMCALVIPVIIYTPFVGPWNNSTIQLGFFKYIQIQKQQVLKLKQENKVSINEDGMNSLMKIESSKPA